MVMDGSTFFYNETEHQSLQAAVADFIASQSRSKFTDFRLHAAYTSVHDPGPDVRGISLDETTANSSEKGEKPKYTAAARQVSDVTSTLSQLVGTKKTLRIKKGWSHLTMLAVLVVGILLGSFLEHYYGLWGTLLGAPTMLRDSVLLSFGILPDVNTLES